MQWYVQEIKDNRKKEKRINLMGLLHFKESHEIVVNVGDQKLDFQIYEVVVLFEILTLM